MFDFERRESLRCLFASVASMTVMDWLLKRGRLGPMAVEAEDIDDMLVNIRSFFVARTGLSLQEVLNKFIPMGQHCGATPAEYCSRMRSDGGLLLTVLDKIRTNTYGI